MRTDPRILLRGLAKLVAVVVAAGLAGAFIGIALAKLSGGGGASEPVLPAATTTGTTATRTATAPATPTVTSTRPTATTSTSTTTTPTSAGVYHVPRVQVLSAQLVNATGQATRVVAKIRVTNRGSRALKLAPPVLISLSDEAPLDAVHAQARALLRAIAPGSSATGTLHFTLGPVIAQRLAASPAARLRIAGRTVLLKLTPSAPVATSTTTTP